jgi:hypothetical protein
MFSWLWEALAALLSPNKFGLWGVPPNVHLRGRDTFPQLIEKMPLGGYLMVWPILLILAFQDGFLSL